MEGVSTASHGVRGSGEVLVKEPLDMPRMSRADRFPSRSARKRGTHREGVSTLPCALRCKCIPPKRHFALKQSVRVSAPHCSPARLLVPGLGALAYYSTASLETESTCAPMDLCFTGHSTLAVCSEGFLCAEGSRFHHHRLKGSSVNHYLSLASSNQTNSNGRR